MFREADEDSLRREWRERSAAFRDAARCDTLEARRIVARAGFGLVAVAIVVSFMLNLEDANCLALVMLPCLIAAAVIGWALAPFLLRLEIHRQTRETDDVRSDLERVRHAPDGALRRLHRSSVVVATVPMLIITPLLVLASVIPAFQAYFDSRPFRLGDGIAMALPWIVPAIVGTLLAAGWWLRHPSRDWPAWQVVFLVPGALRFPIVGFVALLAQHVVAIVATRLTRAYSPISV